MKKILALVFLLIINLSATCFARNFETPNPERWVQVFDVERGAMWIDKATLKFDRVDKKYSDHHKHRMVTVWMLSYIKPSNSSLKSLEIFDLDCRVVQRTTVFAEDHNTGQVGDMDCSHEPPRAIIPDSADEALLIVFEGLWKEKEKEKKKK